MAPPLPSTVSEFPSVVKFILKVSSPPPPVKVSVPAPPEIIKLPVPALVILITPPPAAALRLAVPELELEAVATKLVIPFAVRVPLAPT